MSDDNPPTNDQNAGVQNAGVPLKRTPLYDLHVELGAKLVPFAGYEMPVQFPLGVMKEHLWTRENAGLFDVSHMGQAYLIGPDHETTARALEALCPAAFLKLGLGRVRYTQLLNDDGGIIDDLMVSRFETEADDGRLMLVVNGARKVVDFKHIKSRFPKNVTLELAPNRALLALQGPRAKDVMAALSPDAVELGFMTAITTNIGTIDCQVARSGYTGEDGFEISVAAGNAMELAQLLLTNDLVQPIGLGARDSLRLEAGLCLYGQDIDEATSPIEADIAWSIQKRRREEGGFPGAARIQGELREGPARLRVGIKPSGRAPAREGTVILDANGNEIGIVTSGGFGPSLKGPVTMGYVASDSAEPGTPLQLVVRGKPMPATVADLPFVPHRYYRKS